MRRKKEHELKNQSEVSLLYFLSLHDIKGLMLKNKANRCSHLGGGCKEPVVDSAF